MNTHHLFKAKKKFDEHLLAKDPGLFYTKIMAMVTGAFMLGRITKR